jgi:hypothetical protein
MKALTMKKMTKHGIIGLAAIACVGGTLSSGSYYAIGGGPGNVANALADINGQAPTATLTATTVCFPSCGGSIGDGATLADFFGGNAINVSANSVNDLSGHVLVLTGSVHATTAGNYTFSLGSDDGSAMWINNALAVNNDYDHGFQYQSATVALTAGWNAIKIVQFEDGGGTGLSVLENGVGLGGNNISTVSGVPETSTWAMMLAGFAGLGFAGYRRNKAASAAA